jgi:hypothetical protein
MKKTLFILLMLVVVFANAGSFSSGGRGFSGGGFRSGGFSSYRSTSSFSRPSYSRPSYSRPSLTTAAPSRTITRTTIVRSYSRNVYSSGHYYGGWGMGYSYHSGLMTGLILGNLMHPYGTVMYAGPGIYTNNALLYPNGQVVNQQGYLVGNYINGQFIPVQNGAMVAQAVPTDAYQQQSAQPVQQTAPQPVIVQQSMDAGVAALLIVFSAIFAIIILAIIIL